MRHVCHAGWVEKASGELTLAAREIVGRSPFKHMLHLRENEVNSHILKELILRWSPVRKSFKIGKRWCPFSPKDVALILGMRVGGVRIDENTIKKGVFKVSKIMEENGIKNTPHRNQLMTLLATQGIKESPADQAIVYILICFAVFLFPISCKNLPWNYVLYTLDDIDSLGDYAWGGLVYENLVTSITSVHGTLIARKNTTDTWFNGCAAILQVRFFFCHV